METAPGAAFRYTNAGFSMLAAIVERVTGGSYEAFVRDRLFAPAGLRTAAFRGPSGDGVARGHDPSGAPSDQPYVWGTRGSGGIIMSVADLYRWHLALRGDAVLDGAARATMFAPRPAEAWGWHVDPRPDLGGTLIHKGGGMPDFASQILYVPESDLVAIWTCNNLKRRWRRGLNKGLLEIAQGRPYGVADALRDTAGRAPQE
jgi:CubicO group peptidase (beta-lactamase class C family)